MYVVTATRQRRQNCKDDEARELLMLMFSATRELALSLKVSLDAELLVYILLNKLI